MFVVHDLAADQLRAAVVREAELVNERDCRREVVVDAADVFHPLERDARSAR